MSDVSLPITAAIELPSTHIAASLATDCWCWAGSVGIAVGMFALLANQHWVPGGDSELYVAAARNLLLHHFALRGYLFNGQPTTIAPPGWPYILAAAMKISTRFWFLKAINLLAMTGSLAIAYPICRRFAPPSISALTIVFTALTSNVFPLTFWLHSDAVFCLCTAASFLLALQIGEGRCSIARIVLLCALCAVACTIRYAGMFSWVIMAGALLQHRQLPLRQFFNDPVGRRLVVTALAALLVSASIGGGWLLKLRVDAQAALLIREAGGAEDSGIDVHADGMAHRDIGLLNADQGGARTYLIRPFLIGNWLSYLFWQPFRFAAIGWLNLISLLFGWLLLAPLITLAVVEYREQRRFWAAVVAIVIALGMFWPHTNARYLVPMAYLLLIGFWKGARLIATAIPRSAPCINIGLIVFVCGFLACNGTLYGVEVWAQRSTDFYGTYEAGLNKDLIAACNWLDGHPLPPGARIAVSERYVNLSKIPKTSYLGLRVTTMLTGRPVLAIPTKYMKSRATSQPGWSDPNTPSYLFDPDPVQYDVFLAWARKSDVKYFLYQPPVSPWRALHFRVGWLQERATKLPVVDTDAGWRLYKVPTTGPSAERIKPLPDTGDWPLRVPGL